MKKNLMLRTNLLVCLILIAGFSITSVLSYRANFTASLQNIEQITDLTSEGIYYQISDTFTKPVNVSLTMAHDSLLREFLYGERSQLDDPEYLETLREYLDTYHREHGFDSVFLVSAATQRYYNFNGMDRVLTPDDPENEWYYAMMENGARCTMNVDNDQVAGADNHVTVFVNCRIPGSGGETLGVVGVGLRIDNLQELLRSYDETFGVSAYLLDDGGTVQISEEHTGYDKVPFFSICAFPEDVQREIMDWSVSGRAHSLWAGNGAGDSYVVTRYIPELQWRLVVERDTGDLVSRMNRQLFVSVCIIVLLIAGVLWVITWVFRSYDRRLVALTRDIERERRSVFEKTTEQLFESIYEIDITHNCPADRAAAAYFESLGAPLGTPFSKALEIVAQRQVKEEFRQGYLETFSPENVLRSLEAGRDSLQYDLLVADGGGGYQWRRITARIVRWESDGSVHLLVYRQDIHAQKLRELRMQELVQRDGMTGLLTKTATQQHIDETLRAAPGGLFGFYIIDIDCFKTANDQFGHVFGDKVIRSFARSLQGSFREGDIIGRLGGDEFAVFIPVPSADWAVQQAQRLSASLDGDFQDEGRCWHVSASIGVSVAPGDGGDFAALYEKADQALYGVKKRGRNGFALYKEP